MLAVCSFRLLYLFVTCTSCPTSSHSLPSPFHSLFRFFCHLYSLSFFASLTPFFFSPLFSLTITLTPPYYQVYICLVLEQIVTCPLLQVLESIDIDGGIHLGETRSDDDDDDDDDNDDDAATTAATSYRHPLATTIFLLNDIF